MPNSTRATSFEEIKSRLVLLSPEELRDLDKSTTSELIEKKKKKRRTAFRKATLLGKT